MLRMLRNLTVNIIAAFICDREDRHQFRDKYKIKSKFRKLRDDNRRLFNENKMLLEKLIRLQTGIDSFNKKRMYKFGNGTVEKFRGFLKVESTEFSYRYINLIKGLDSESIDCVTKILGRMSFIAQQNLGQESNFKGAVDIFTDDELQQLDLLEKEFKQRIIPLSDGCYAYKQYILPVKWFLPNVFYYKQEMHKLKYLERIKDKDIIDVGGCIADSAIVFAEYTTGNIYTFEPVSANYDLMLKTIKLNACKNIVPVKLGLGSKEEKQYINIKNYAQNIGGNMIIQNQIANINSDDYEYISINTLDNYLKENNLNIGLIKVDIEGFEQEFLKGAEDTIRKFRPSMLISIYHNPSDFFNIKPLIDSWGLGYSFKISRSVDGTISGETMLICELGS